LPTRNEPHSAQIVEGVGSDDVDGTEVDLDVARGTRSDDVEGTIPETVSDNVDDSAQEFCYVAKHGDVCR
jgi:hypothetical protein